MTNWIDTLRQHASSDPRAVAIVERNGARVTRGELSAQISAATTALEASGFTAGDKALFSIRPGATALALVLAIHELGGVLLPFDPGVADALFDSRIALLEPRWVFAESILLISPSGLVARLLRARGLHFAPLGGVAGARFFHSGPRLPGMPPSRPVRSLLRPRRGIAPLSADTGMDRGSDLDPSSPAFVVCTSGTTSHPKAVVHSRQSLRAIVSAVSAQVALGEHDVVFARDLHLMLPAMLVGARIVVPPGSRFHARGALAVMERETVSHAFLVTRDCRLLLEECMRRGRKVPSSVRSLMIGAAPVRAPFLAQLATVLPLHTVAWCVYGTTEVLPVACVSLAEKVAYAGVGDLVGRVLPGLTVRIDEHGQLCVRGDRMFSGYAGEPPVSEHATGDLASLCDGRIVLLGRCKDMIIRGEYNIYPSLYEPLVEQVPGVRRAAMIGDFDEVSADERVILVVEPEANVDASLLLARVTRAVREGPLRFDSSAQPDRILIAALPEAGRSHKVDKSALRRSLGVASCA